MTTASIAALLVVVVFALGGGAFALGGEVFSGDGQGSGQAHHEADGSRTQHAEEGIFSHENSSIAGPSDISVIGEVK